jgi:protein-S-isoprenylcysteine O-methyltransferase Ste14
MENQQLSQNQPELNIKLNMKAVMELKSAGRWSMFLAILGFFGLGIMFLIAILFGFSGGILPTGTNLNFPMYMVSIVYLVLIAIYFIPIYYLFQFSKRTSNILIRPDDSNILEAFSYLRRHYQYIGILTIIVLSLYIIGIIITVATSIALYS